MFIHIYVPGTPQPGGSKKALPITLGHARRKNPADRAYFPKLCATCGFTGRVAVTDDAKYGKQWRTAVTIAARNAVVEQRMTKLFPIPAGTPVAVQVLLVMPRPAVHMGTGRNAGRTKDSAPIDHLQKPDATKLWRSTEDALTGILWHDDVLIVHQIIAKTWSGALKPGAYIDVLAGPEAQRRRIEHEQALAESIYAQTMTRETENTA